MRTIPPPRDFTRVQVGPRRARKPPRRQWTLAGDFPHVAGTRDGQTRAHDMRHRLTILIITLIAASGTVTPALCVASRGLINSAVCVDKRHGHIAPCSRPSSSSFHPGSMRAGSERALPGRRLPTRGPGPAGRRGPTRRARNAAGGGCVLPAASGCQYATPEGSRESSRYVRGGGASIPEPLLRKSPLEQFQPKCLIPGWPCDWIGPPGGKGVLLGEPVFVCR
jgi:hypothetical protein